MIVYERPSTRTVFLARKMLQCSALVSAAFIISAVTLLIHHERDSRTQMSGLKTKVCDCPRDVDIVVTWVNGTDPAFQRSLSQTYRKVRRKLGLQQQDQQLDLKRYLDSEELRFCLRSIEKFAPWVRTIYIVTNGQVPHWLDAAHPQIRVVSHDRIFPDKSHLPTFSSPAIESNLHRIPGLSEHFIYLNDDIYFGRPVSKDDFYTAEKGQIVWPTYDAPSFYMVKDAYGLSMAYVDELYTNTFGRPGRSEFIRKVPTHGPLYVQKSVIRDCQQQFKEHWRRTSSHQFRMANDMQYSFSYVNFLKEKRHNLSAAEIFDNYNVDSDEVWSLSEAQDFLEAIQSIRSGRATRLANRALEAINRCKADRDTLWGRLANLYGWTITKSVLLSCSEVVASMASLKGEKKYRYTEEDHNVVRFVIFNSNIEQAAKVFRTLREEKPKMVCINNGLDGAAVDNNTVVAGLQLQYMEEMFPARSGFEVDDPHFTDPMHTKLRVRCSLDEANRRMYCLENTGRRFDIALAPPPVNVLAWGGPRGGGAHAAAAAGPRDFNKVKSLIKVGERPPDSLQSVRLGKKIKKTNQTNQAEKAAAAAAGKIIMRPGGKKKKVPPDAERNRLVAENQPSDEQDEVLSEKSLDEIDRFFQRIAEKRREEKDSDTADEYDE